MDRQNTTPRQGDNMIEDYIKLTSEGIIGLYKDCKERLETMDNESVRSLLHVSEDKKTSEFFSERASAEINRAACIMVLEDREP
jgi:hypothetical protein